MRIAAYLRASTDKQIDSPDVQLGIIREFAARDGHEIVGIYTDFAVSGGTEIDDRPAFRQLLTDKATKGIEGVALMQILRLSRNTRDFLNFKEAARSAKLKLVYATGSYSDDSSGDLQQTIEVAFGEKERRQTGERVFQHNRQLVAMGRWPSGRPPIGYAYDPGTKTLSVDTERIEDAVAVFQTFCACGGNKCQTAARLNTVGIRTGRDGLWRDDGVAFVVRNPIYRGRLHYADLEMECDTIPRIITAELLARADYLLQITKGKRTRAAQRVYTYSSILTCSLCGSTFKVCSARNGYEMYVCRGKKERGICAARKVSSNWLDAHVPEGLKVAIESERLLIAEATRNDDQERIAEESRRRRISGLKEKKRRNRQMFEAGIIDAVEELQARLAELDREIEELSSRGIQRHATTSAVLEVVDNLPEYWPSATVDERRKMLLAFCPTLYLDTQKRQVTMPTTLSVGTITLPP
jgi:DNA invertase Pin-like site-specific DNA recombinase